MYHRRRVYGCDDDSPVIHRRNARWVIIKVVSRKRRLANHFDTLDDPDSKPFFDWLEAVV